jgi:hypothetical protein
MTNFDKEQIRKWRRGTHVLPPAIGDVARDVLDELTRLQGVNADLLAACEAAMRISDLWLPTEWALPEHDEEARALAAMAEKIKGAIEKARKTC